MGIQGLLLQLKSTTTPVHIRDYAGKVVAVDTYSWLHKGAFTCSKALCEGLPTTKYVDYCMRRVDLLRQHGIKPLLVFDGGILPMKEEQENKRARKRKFNLDRAREHEMSGNHDAAYQCYQKAVDITPQIAFQLVKILQQEQISYIVAPYEADAQLAFLCLNGHVDVVITEDSDLIPFGCPKVMFKMDKFGGVEFQNDDLAKSRDINFTSFTKQMFLETCILSGCDYLPSLPGMGFKKAHGLITRFRNYQKVLKHLRYSGVCIPSDYDDAFTKAILTFKHQRVYDPVLQDIVHLTQVPSDLTLNLDFLGPALSQKLGQAIARGEIDPLTGKGFEPVIFQDQPVLKSAPSKTGGSNGLLKRHFDLPVQKNQLTNYFVSASKEAKRQFKAPRNKDPSENICDVLSLEEDDFQTIQPIEPSINSLGLGAATDVRQHCRNLDFSISIEEEDEVRTFLNSEMTPMASVVLPETSSEGHGLTNSPPIKRKSFLQKNHENCVVQSAYFLKRNKAKEISTTLETVPSISKEDTLGWFSEMHSSPEEPDHSEDKKFIDSVSENSKSTSQQQPWPTGDEPKTDGSYCGSRTKHGGKLVDFISAGEKKHVPAFSSKLLGVSVQPVKFASDTSHIEQYTSIAQKSMDRFVAAIAPFCLSSSGARASGLRRPLKSSLTDRKKKSAEDLIKLAYARPRYHSSPGRGKSVRGMTCAARYKDSFLADWD